MRKYIKIIVFATAASLGACNVGPAYHRPDVAVPSAYKESVNADWARANPADALHRGAWWELFGDATLNDLEKQVEVSNQSLKQAEAQYRQAQAVVAGARSEFFPVVTVGAQATRSGRYGNSGSIVSGGTVIGTDAGSTDPRSSHPSNTYSLPFQASWEPDLWGRVRDTVSADVANAQASAATLESTKLSLQATLAQDYFQLRIVDEQKRLLDDTVVAYQRSLQLTQNQYNVGVVARADVVQADVQLKSAQVQAIDLGVSRTQLEHAIALLIGKAPADFSLSTEPLKIEPPRIPSGMPSQLLERRPDVAIAERQMAAANAQIGVADSAFFPSLTLNATAGYQSSSFSKWLTAPSRFWSLGPELAETLLDFGARRAQVNQAKAAYDANVANYREVALAALQNVEDNLSALRILEQEAAAQNEAVKAAQQSLTISLNQYRAGTVSYLDVVTAQTAAYSNQRNAISILGNRLNDSVALIKALGGGWTQTDLPTASGVEHDTVSATMHD